MPAGASSTRPGSTASPWRASRTGMALRASSRSASERVKPRGMCCTITTAAGKAAGSAETTACSAEGPPVEAAIVTHWAEARPAATSPLGCVRGRERTRAPPSARIFEISSSARLSMLIGSTEDLSTNSIAPSSSPRSVVSAPSCVSVDISSTGTGCSAISRSSVSSPPSFGMRTSSVTTSGRSSRASARPSSPSRAKPTTSMSSAVASMRPTALRTNAESSTTSTRILSLTTRPLRASGTRSLPGNGSGRRRSRRARATRRGRGTGSPRAPAPGGTGSPRVAPPRPRSR